jgi:signal transduction histidine kinase
MKRPWQVWLAFLVCSVVLCTAMGWLTVHAVRVDRERSRARAEAELEQRVGLALWRMDTKLAPLIAQEIARPHAFYDSFVMTNSGGGKVVAPVASPLLNSTTPNVILNFDATAEGRWKSPQAPPEQQAPLALANGMSPTAMTSNRNRLAELAKKVDVAALISQLPAEPLPQQVLGWPNAAPNSEPNSEAGEVNLRQHKEPSQQAFLAPPLGGNDDENPFDSDEQQVANGPATKPSAANQQVAQSANDFGQRQSRYQQAAQQEFTKQRGANSFWAQNAAIPQAPVVENASRPVWVGDELLLARRVERGGETSVQGSWLDWPKLRADLLSEAAALSLNANLVPVRSEAEAEPTRMLAVLPVRLVVNDSESAIAGLAAVDAPFRWALGFGWVALGLALAAVAALLWGVLALSERRAAFVSSVTHELRTPLTTFRMYAEMLARDMAPAASRREYLETLKKEAERLTHLVENVLSYARLERGRRPQRSERTTARALVERFEPRLAERAAQANMQLVCDVEQAAATATLVTDVGVVEQILFNLVDNAAKYAARAADRRIQLKVSRSVRFVSFTVRDYGPGFASPREAARSAPFSKSAQQAAETAPGVGLGLALCRRLARELGGRLEIAPNNGEAGASITLILPTDAS